MECYTYLRNVTDLLSDGKTPYERRFGKKVRNKSEVIDEARTKGIKVHFASLMDICHLKNAELEQSTKNTKVELCFEATL